MDNELNLKYENLKSYIKNLENAAIAFSSGVDSTFLLDVSKEILGENIVALIAFLNSFPQRELNEAVDFCKNKNIKYEIIPVDEFEIEGYKNNPFDRCYLCKKKIIRKN